MRTERCWHGRGESSLKLITDAVRQNASVDSTFFRRFSQDGG
jgi:hypothetical protein